MSPAALIEHLAGRGIRFELTGDTVEVIGADRLDDAELATLREHKDALRRFLASQPRDPAANDTPHGPTREDLLRALGDWFPIEAGPDDQVMVRTTDVLAHADEAAVIDLLDIGALIDFAASLVAEGLVDARIVRNEPEPPPLLPVPARTVRCCDCQHFEADTVGSGQGIGRCAISAPERRKQPSSSQFPAGHYGDAPALWPLAERACEQFEQTEAGRRQFSTEEQTTCAYTC